MLNVSVASSFFLAQAMPRFASSSVIVFFVLMVGGALGWLIAAVLGFARANAFGASTRWFALSALCLFIYHLQFVALGYLGLQETDVDKVLSFGAFFNLFVMLGAICAIIGFVRLTNPRP